MKFTFIEALGRNPTGGTLLVETLIEFQVFWYDEMEEAVPLVFDESDPVYPEPPAPGVDPINPEFFFSYAENRSEDCLDVSSPGFSAVECDRNMFRWRCWNMQIAPANQRFWESTDVPTTTPFTVQLDSFYLDPIPAIDRWRARGVITADCEGFQDTEDHRLAPGIVTFSIQF